MWQIIMSKSVSEMLIFIPLLLLKPNYVASLTYCYEGTYEIERPDGYLMCDLCPEGTYMPEYDHRHTACYNCTKTQSHLEVVYSPCTRKNDTIIHCVDGYYRDLPRNINEKANCKKCTECSLFTGRPCQTYSDTICCHYENSEVVLHRDGYLICQERPYLCRKGQYFNTSTSECLPCSVNTFMSLDYHVMTECWKCPHYNLPLHAEIIQPCNSTQAPVVACKKGFYMNHAMTMSYYNTVGCSACTDCEKHNMYKGRACNSEHDTVCCQHPNMTVLDTPGGPRCEEQLAGIPDVVQQSAIYCGENQFVFTNSSTKSVMCQPCPVGSYMNSSNHTSSTCDNCMNFIGEEIPLPCMMTTSRNITVTIPCEFLCPRLNDTEDGAHTSPHKITEESCPHNPDGKSVFESPTFMSCLSVLCAISIVVNAVLLYAICKRRGKCEDMPKTNKKKNKSRPTGARRHKSTH